MNVEGALLTTKGFSVVGIVIPDQKGEFLPGMSKRLGMVGCAKYIGALAVGEGVSSSHRILEFLIL